MSSSTKETPFAAFLTRERANAGIVVDLVGPCGPTGESLTIYGADSDTFQAAKRVSDAKLAELISVRKTGTTFKVDLVEERLQVLAVLVKSWTRKVEFTRENVVAFLRAAPQIADQIDTISADRSLLMDT